MDGRPVRTVVYIEVGNMSHEQYLQLATAFAGQYRGTVTGEFFLVPIRHGRVPTETHFEAEFLTVVKHICEVKDGEIVMKQGAQDVKIVREYVDEGEADETGD